MIDLMRVRLALQAACAPDNADEALPSELVEQRLGRESVFELAGPCLPAAVAALQELGYHHLSAITALCDGADVQVLYHFWAGTGLSLRVRCPRPEQGAPTPPSLPSLTHLLPVAAWYEREVHDLFGIDFAGHPTLSPLLLPEGWSGPPPMVCPEEERR